MKRKLKLKKLLMIHNAFKTLNGCNRVVKENGEEKSVFAPYALEAKPVRDIYRNLAALSTIRDWASEAEKTLVAGLNHVPERAPDAPIQTDAEKTAEASARFKKLNEELEKLLESEIEVELFSITYSDLNIGTKTDQNRIQSGTLADLDDLLIY